MDEKVKDKINAALGIIYSVRLSLCNVSSSVYDDIGADDLCDRLELAAATIEKSGFFNEGRADLPTATPTEKRKALWDVQNHRSVWEAVAIYPETVDTIERALQSDERQGGDIPGLEEALKWLTEKGTGVLGNCFMNPMPWEIRKPLIDAATTAQKSPDKQVTATSVPEGWQPINTKINYRIVEHHGTIDTNTGRTINEHWMVNGKRFDHAPAPEEAEEAYKIDGGKDPHE